MAAAQRRRCWGGGFDRIGFQGNSDTSQKLIKVVNGGEIYWNQCEVGEGVATLLRVDSTTSNASTMVFDGLKGRVPNIPAPLFQLVNGAGFLMSNPNVYNQAFDEGGTAVG